MSYFDNKQKNLLPEDLEQIFTSILGDCYVERDYYGYWTKKDYEEHFNLEIWLYFQIKDYFLIYIISFVITKYK